LISLNFYISK